MLGEALSIYQVGQLGAELCARMKANETLQLDLSAVTEFDGAGLQLLVFLQQESARRQSTLQLSGTSANVAEAFRLCGLEKWLALSDAITNTPADTPTNTPDHAHACVADETAHALTTPLKA